MKIDTHKTDSRYINNILSFKKVIVRQSKVRRFAKSARRILIQDCSPYLVSSKKLTILCCLNEMYRKYENQKDHPIISRKKMVTVTSTESELANW